MLLLATIGAVILSSVSGTRSLQQFSIANAPAADLISAGLTAIQSDPKGTATALANCTPYALTNLPLQPSIALVCYYYHVAMQKFRLLAWCALGRHD